MANLSSVAAAWRAKWCLNTVLNSPLAPKDMTQRTEIPFRSKGAQLYKTELVPLSIDLIREPETLGKTPDRMPEPS